MQESTFAGKNAGKSYRYCKSLAAIICNLHAAVKFCGNADFRCLFGD